VGAARAQCGLTPPGRCPSDARCSSDAPGETRHKGLRRLSATLMANRPDQHLANLSNCHGQARSPDQEKGADFHHGPGAQCSAPSRGQVHDRNRKTRAKQRPCARGWVHTYNTYNLGNLWRRLALPAQIGKWPLTSLQQRLVKTGGRLIKHAPWHWLLLAESDRTPRLFGGMLRKIATLPSPTG
jgi:hypothetical protein